MALMWAKDLFKMSKVFCLENKPQKLEDALGGHGRQGDTGLTGLTKLTVFRHDLTKRSRQKWVRSVTAKSFKKI